MSNWELLAGELLRRLCVCSTHDCATPYVSPVYLTSFLQITDLPILDPTTPKQVEVGDGRWLIPH